MERADSLMPLITASDQLSHADRCPT
jgi:hypothetical protein